MLSPIAHFAAVGTWGKASGGQLLGTDNLSTGSNCSTADPSAAVFRVAHPLALILSPTFVSDAEASSGTPTSSSLGAPKEPRANTGLRSREAPDKHKDRKAAPNQIRTKITTFLALARYQSSVGSFRLSVIVGILHPDTPNRFNLPWRRVTGMVIEPTMSASYPPSHSLGNRRCCRLVLHDLPLVDQRGLVVAEIDLVLNAVGGIDDRLYCRVYDFPGVHVDFDYVADFGLIFRHAPEFYYTSHSPAGPVVS
jgi:hypothetical protein